MLALFCGPGCDLPSQLWLVAAASSAQDLPSWHDANTSELACWRQRGKPRGLKPCSQGYQMQLRSPPPWPLLLAGGTLKSRKSMSGNTFSKRAGQVKSMWSPLHSISSQTQAPQRSQGSPHPEQARNPHSQQTHASQGSMSPPHAEQAGTFLTCRPVSAWRAWRPPEPSAPAIEPRVFDARATAARGRAGQ